MNGEDEVPEVIPYASPGNNRRVSPVATIRTVSIAIGIATLLMAAGGILSTFQELRTIRMEASYRGPAYAEEFETRHDNAITMGIVLTAFVPISLLLIFTGRTLSRSPGRGFVMLWIYAILQFAAGIALGVVFMQAIYYSPGGMLFFIGAFPGLLACAYPTFLLIYLPFVADKFTTPR